ncbi:endoglucanase type c [Pyrenophora seminiperda CCB06]|uniref:Endoglucanase type c n=1 Tax=Pyrenophora seminiperda CCB06 TaxID=1302712 RepID=A0A3M7MCZ1_9PLEO|nr:endoglucanase type c [Pyrenophora seminiperda CCB06]
MATDMMYIRPPTSPFPRNSEPKPRMLTFRHPSYDDEGFKNVLFRLYAVDIERDASHHNEQDASQRPGLKGLYTQFALDACAIIAGNRTEGWLSTLRNPQQARDNRVDANSILHEDDYYFHLPQDENADGFTDPYPTVRTFSEWIFPHQRIPPYWQQLPAPSKEPFLYTPANSWELTSAVRYCDRHCRISGHRDELQVAHIVPQDEAAWWKTNDMNRYNYNILRNDLDDVANAILLRADLHLAWDRRRFVFVPKPSSDGSGMRLVCHTLDPPAGYWHLYHNRELHNSAVGVEQLFARFAWSLFSILNPLLSHDVVRRSPIRTAVDNQGLSSRYFTGYFPTDVCQKLSTAANKKRLTSPEEFEKDEHADDNTVKDRVAVCRHVQTQNDATTPPFPSAPNPRKRSIGTTLFPQVQNADAAKEGKDVPPTTLQEHTSPSSPAEGSPRDEIKWAEDGRWGRGSVGSQVLTVSGDEVTRVLKLSGYDDMKEVKSNDEEMCTRGMSVGGW